MPSTCSASYPMRFIIWMSVFALEVVVTLTACSFDSRRPPAGSTSSSNSSSIESSDVVACQLPGEIRPLGPLATYVSRGQIVRTTLLHCAQRGGQVLHP
jgi:hypothetical protein